MYRTKLFKQNLEAAGIPYCDKSGKYVDFHSFRYTFDTNLARGGKIGERTRMELMRHSDPRLTSIRHTDAGQLPIVAAIMQLPSFLNPQSAPAAEHSPSNLPSDLKPLADNWERLPKGIRDALLAIAQTAQK